MLEISLPGIFEDQGSGYPLRVSKVTLKWTDPVKILTKGQLESNLMYMHHAPCSQLPICLQVPQLKWTLVAKGTAVMNESELATLILKILITMTSNYPSRYLAWP